MHPASGRDGLGRAWAARGMAAARAFSSRTFACGGHVGQCGILKRLEETSSASRQLCLCMCTLSRALPLPRASCVRLRDVLPSTEYRTYCKTKMLRLVLRAFAQLNSLLDITKNSTARHVEAPAALLLTASDETLLYLLYTVHKVQCTSTLGSCQQPTFVVLPRMST